jgi:hypothetical protein
MEDLRNIFEEKGLVMPGWLDTLFRSVIKRPKIDDVMKRKLIYAGMYKKIKVLIISF